MKQRWLIAPPPASESTLIIDFDSSTRSRLVALMAKAIESVWLQHTNPPHQATDTPTNERTATPSQD